jgi:hypothetical protein
MKPLRIQADHLIDALGQTLRVGDRATLSHVDRRYLYSLPTEKQDLYETRLDKVVTISDVDDCGAVAIAFQDQSGAEQEFWIEPAWLRRLPI